MSDNKVSVIVPVYNKERFLEKCIKSILNQSYNSLEIILIDDGSTDRSAEICDRYAKLDSRIYVVHKENEGVAEARNTGLNIASSKFVTFVDSDDFIDPEMYKKMVMTALSTDADIVECGYNETNLKGNVLKEYKLDEKTIIGSYNASYHYARNENTTNFVWNKLFKRELLKDIRFPDTIISEDFVFNVKAYYKCKKTVIISDPLYNYVYNDKGITKRGFHPGRLDAIKNGKEMYHFHQERYPDLCSFFALYIVEYSMRFYKEVYEQKDLKDRDKYLKSLKKEFMEFYSLIKGDAFNKIKKKKIRVLMWIFKTNPIFYYWTMKLFKK
ncbi:MAG: glycosyltransferase family 2 protein [bacterium]